MSGSWLAANALFGLLVIMIPILILFILMVREVLKHKSRGKFVELIMLIVLFSFLFGAYVALPFFLLILIINYRTKILKTLKKVLRYGKG